MTAVVVIPARYASKRYPGKPLVMLKGAGGVAKSLIQWSWEAAKAVPGIARVVVATDDDRIAEHAHGFGAEVAMTPETCRNGTERCASALDALGEVEVVVNLQGDAPLTPPWFVTALVERMGQGAEMATPVLRLDRSSLDGFRADRAAGRVGGTTAVFDRRFRALYFSKEVLPYIGDQVPEPIPAWHHVGVYAYTPKALRAYASWPEGPLEALEGLEQLRFLENGHPIDCVEVEAKGRTFWELNNPSDVERVEVALADLGEA